VFLTFPCSQCRFPILVRRGPPKPLYVSCPYCGQQNIAAPNIEPNIEPNGEEEAALDRAWKRIIAGNQVVGHLPSPPEQEDDHE
jgi:hypothetical protein